MSLNQLGNHVVGRILQGGVREAIAGLQLQLPAFTVSHKDGLDGQLDVVTSLDRWAQDSYGQLVEECFPGYGFYAEEGPVAIPCMLGAGLPDCWLTADGMDGSRAAVRGQLDKLATQIALVVNNRVTSAYIGSVRDGTIYGFYPGSAARLYLSPVESIDLERVDRDISLKHQKVLLRGSSEAYDPIFRSLLSGGSATFRGTTTDWGSLSLSFTRLWLAEVGAVMLAPHYETPWDSAPIFGMNRRLGIVALRSSADGKQLVEWEQPIRKEPYRRGFSLIFVHSSRVQELQQKIAV